MRNVTATVALATAMVASACDPPPQLPAGRPSKPDAGQREPAPPAEPQARRHDPSGAGTTASTVAPARDKVWHCVSAGTCTEVADQGLCTKLLPKAAVEAGPCSMARTVAGCRESGEIPGFDGPQRWVSWYTTSTRFRCRQLVESWCSKLGGSVVPPHTTPNAARSCLQLEAAGHCRAGDLCNEYDAAAAARGRSHCDGVAGAVWHDAACPREDAIGVCVAPRYSWWTYAGDPLLGKASVAEDRCINASGGVFLPQPAPSAQGAR